MGKVITFRLVKADFSEAFTSISLLFYFRRRKHI